MNTDRTSETVSFVVDSVKGGRMNSLNINLKPGEILGIAGLVGSGAEEVPYLLFGAQSCSEGTISVGANTIAARELSPKKAIEMGIGMVPADRGKDGLIRNLSIWENELFLVNSRYFRSGIMHRKQARADATRRCEEFGIVTSGSDSMVASLSGGNQQKVLLAKWCEIRPSVLLLHEPTQGVDVGARRDLYRIIRGLADGGTSVIWVATDYEELASMSDRIDIVAQGRVVSSLTKDELTVGSLMLAVSGA